MASRTQVAHAIIIGGGIAGLSAGVALRKAGYKVTLYEQAERIEPLGAALSIWGNAMAGLDWMECGEAVRRGSAPIPSVALRGLSGRVLFGPADVADTHSYLPMRAHLQSVLLDRLGTDNCRFGKRFASAAQDGDQAVAQFEDGENAKADLLIIADGIHSAAATKLLGNAPRYCGYAGALGIAEADHGNVPTQCFEEVWGERDRFGLFSAGQNRLYWFYMAAMGEADAAKPLPLKGIQAAASQYPQAYQQALAATHADSTIPLAIHARPAPTRLGEGRIICIGDAAHAMEPNQGQGACQGIEDAWALGLLAQQYAPYEILPRLEKMRLGRIRRAMRDSHLIGRAAHSPRKWERNIARTILACAPAGLDSYQLRTRIAPPQYSL